jgi:hypothetical protein
MRMTDTDLKAATDAGIITPSQYEGLLAFLAQQPARVDDQPRRSFDVVHLLWYAGALIVITAMGLFSTLAFAQMGGTALTITAVIYAIGFGLAGRYLWVEKGLQTPGGLLIAIAVTMAPLAVYGIQDALGLWSRFGKPGTVRDFYIWIKGSWIFMETAAIAAAALALRFFRFPFLVLIVAFALWFMSMDIVPWITQADARDWETSRQVSIAFGFAMIVIAVAVNGRQQSGDFAFWLYLFGTLTFWGGITATSGGTPLGKALYCAMNVGFLFLSVFLGRRVFAVFGTIGIAIYLGDLAAKVFKDSLLFPFALSLIGVAVIALGLYMHRHRDALETWFDTQLPPALKRLRPVNAG